MRIIFTVIILVVVFAINGRSQDTQSSLNTSFKDSLSYSEQFQFDSMAIMEYQQLGKQKWFVQQNGGNVVYDVQQFYSKRKGGVEFVLLLIILGTITYVKIAFGKDVEELLLSFGNRNISQQILRTQSKEFSLSSFLLNANFVVVVSLLTRFFLIEHSHVTSLNSFTGMLVLIFLFTFFYVAKVVSIKFIGLIFDLGEVCNEYIYNLFTVCKTLGLTLIPTVFVLHTAPEFFFKEIFIAMIFVALAFALLFVWRGLSTGYVFLYRSAYHFFIYVCVVEISPIFLLFKLLTKTIT